MVAWRRTGYVPRSRPRGTAPEPSAGASSSIAWRRARSAPRSPTLARTTRPGGTRASARGRGCRARPPSIGSSAARRWGYRGDLPRGRRPRAAGGARGRGLRGGVDRARRTDHPLADGAGDDLRAPGRPCRARPRARRGGRAVDSRRVTAPIDHPAADEPGRPPPGCMGVVLPEAPRPATLPSVESAAFDRRDHL